MTRFEFSPAAPGEGTVYGSCAPDWGSRGDGGVREWIDYVRERGIRRVLCLLSERQVANRPELLDRYEAALGSARVRHLPVEDHTLPSPGRLRTAVSFLRAADHRGERAVVHCLAGIGRTGVTLSGWLVAARGYEPREAVRAVERNGRRPTEAVGAGNATEADLYDLLDEVA